MKYATQEQIQTLLKKAETSVRDYAILTTMYWRGLRASELCALELSDYRRQEGRLSVRRLKGSMSAEYPISPQEKKALEAWLKIRGTQPGPLFVSRRGRALSRRTVFRIVEHYSILAEWPPELRHPHALRHSIAVHLVEKGVDLLAIKDWLGHKAISSTTIYAQVTNPVRERTAMEVYGEAGKIRVAWSKAKKR